jgi:dimethylaniline monooxygenase (N-oxide forming)
MTDRVAVIGAGPGGLVAARWLLSEGFVPTLFEQSPTLGGQWSGQLGRSGIWPAMRTNTSRVLTSFSDLAPSSDLVFPSCQEMLEYLHRYAAIFDLESRIRLETRVENLGPSGSGWRVRHSSGVEDFDRVVIASGRFQTPMIPAVAGLDGFTGSAGVRTTYDYRRPGPFVDKRMLVAGGAISALEIAVELAHGAAASVTVAQRRQRYVLPKFAAGVPSDHRMFTRYATLAHELLPTAEDERQLREIVLGAAGSPEQYGAPAPNPSLFAAGVTLSQNYLPAVAEGRISVRPWIQSVADASVTFVDGHTDEFDGIVFGTGFELRLPFLDDRLQDLLGLDELQLDADRFTFHPDLPGLALMGMWEQSGGYFVPLELQARWIAYTWSGRVPAPAEAAQRAAIAECRARRGIPQKSRMNLVALTFARAAGAEPHLENWPDLRRALLFGPLAPSCFRLEGPDAVVDAPARFDCDAAAFGAITSNEMTDSERVRCAQLASAIGT